MTKYAEILLWTVIAVSATVGVSAQRVNSINRSLKPVNQEAVTKLHEPFDTVRASGEDVLFSGYEKILRATRETVFVSNLSDSCEIGGIIFTVTYLDSSGRILHRRRVEAHPGIPAGETRRVDFPTWDRQMTFYYKGSPRPRVSSIPYDVTIVADTLLLVPAQ